MEERYTAAEIRRYEAIYGRDFISPGGEASARTFLAHATLDAGSNVLDVGCGVGGSAFYMARTFGCRVDGIDLAPEAIRIAQARAAELGLDGLLTFIQGDFLEVATPRPAYDLVYSRDTFLHIPDKARLFAKVRDCLAPNGMLLFTDYVRGAAPPSEEFATYVAAHGYALETLSGYRDILAEAGLEVTRADDLTAAFIAVHREELDRLTHAELPIADVDYLTARWRRKISRAERGEQSWGLFMARKQAGT
ncbi:MAG: Phosphoethanolamine N-methyltransferase [Cyanobacteria bacterium RYN_339]|nr:Phosphoethanolamine N-methyltransferase [Cyanobacteria bacterium RYN_339]